MFMEPRYRMTVWIQCICINELDNNQIVLTSCIVTDLTDNGKYDIGQYRYQVLQFCRATAKNGI